jgi:hypothetical protein
METLFDHYLEPESEDNFDEAQKSSLAERRKAILKARAKRQNPFFGKPTGQRPAKNTREAFGRVGEDMKKTRSAIENMDLDNKVNNDIIGSRFKSQSTRLNRTENALAASQVVNAIISQIPTTGAGKNEVWLKPLLVALPSLSTLFMKSERDGFSNPKVWGPVATIGASALTALVLHLTKDKNENGKSLLIGNASLGGANASEALSLLQALQSGNNGQPINLSNAQYQKLTKILQDAIKGPSHGGVNPATGLRPSKPWLKRVIERLQRPRNREVARGLSRILNPGNKTGIPNFKKFLQQNP